MAGTWHHYCIRKYEPCCNISPCKCWCFNALGRSAESESWLPPPIFGIIIGWLSVIYLYKKNCYCVLKNLWVVLMILALQSAYWFHNRLYDMKMMVWHSSICRIAEHVNVPPVTSAEQETLLSVTLIHEKKAAKSGY